MQTVTQKWTERLAIAMVSVLFGLFLADAIALGWDQVEWETLTAGALAVAAAVLTINQMQKSEHEQSKRHSALMSLNFRGESLRIRRAADPYAHHLLLQYTSIRKFITWEGTDIPEMKREHATIVYTLYKMMANTLAREEFAAIRDMMGAKTNADFNSLLQAKDQLNDPKDDPKYWHNAGMPSVMIAPLVSELAAAAWEISETAKSFAEDILALDRSYSSGEIVSHLTKPSPDRS